MFVHPSWPRRGQFGIPSFAAALLITVAGHAQPAPSPPAAAPRDTPPPRSSPPPLPTAPDAPLEGRDLLAQALAPVASGLRPEQVAKRAAATSPQAASKNAELRAASARVDQAIAAYFPKARVAFSYTRLSRVANNLAGDGPPPALPPELTPLLDLFKFPVILNSYQLTASLEVPLSDYLLRLTQAYATVSLDVDGKRLERRAAELQAARDAKIAYYNWIRAYGQGKVAHLAVLQVEQHLRDAERTQRAGLISQADVLRIQSQHAQALHFTRVAEGLKMVTEQQLRLHLRAKPAERFRIGIDIMTLPPSVDRFSLSQLQQRALTNRLEIKALGKAKASLEEVESLNRAGLYPRVDAFANATYGNPNQRIFPQAQQWNLTWNVGLRASWTINETFTTLGRSAEANARVQAVTAQLSALKNGIIMAVTVAYNDLQTARSAITAAQARERASAEALTLRRRLLLGGKATATEIVDADTELTKARLARVGAHVDAYVAYTRLEHAVGGFGYTPARAKRPASGHAPGPRRAALRRHTDAGRASASVARRRVSDR